MKEQEEVQETFDLDDLPDLEDVDLEQLELHDIDTVNIFQHISDTTNAYILTLNKIYFLLLFEQYMVKGGTINSQPHFQYANGGLQVKKGLF